MKRDTLTGNLACFAAYALFGFNIISCKRIALDGNITPMALFCLRSFGAAVLFWLWSLFTAPREHIARADVWKVVLASFLGLFMTQLSFLFAITQTTAIDASIMATLSPVMTLVISAIFIKDRITWCGVAGILWPTAGEVVDLVKEGEYEKGLDALAARAAKPGFRARLSAICPGTTSKRALARVKTVNGLMAKYGIKMAILARPPDDAKTQDDIAAHYRALGAIAKCPVIIQTYNGKSPQPDVELLIKLAKEFPDVYGYVKEESPGGKVNARMAQLVAAKPVIHTVFSGWGAKAWLYQGPHIGTEGIITQRPAYADILAYLFRQQENGDKDGTLVDAYSKLLLMYNIGETFGGSSDTMRGPHLYVLQKRGAVTNTYTRKRPPKGDMSGKKWIVEEFKLSDAEKAEIDRRLAACAPYLKSR